MSELRERMIRKMDLRNLTKNTQRSYLQSVSGLARFYMISPDKVTKEMIEDYLLYLKHEKGKALTTLGSTITGLRFFYNNVVGDELGFSVCKYTNRHKASQAKGLRGFTKFGVLLQKQGGFKCVCLRAGSVLEALYSVI
jgi:site-specific recombinase XerD